MKKTARILIIAATILSCAIVYSCKEELLVNEAEVISLKKANTASLSPMEQLGKHIFFDKISSPGSMSCAECHAPSVGFTGPIGGLNVRGSVYPGADPQRSGLHLRLI